jgi:hypothetical protein
MYNRQVRTTSGKASHRLRKTGVAHLTLSLPDAFDSLSGFNLVLNWNRPESPIRQDRRRSEFNPGLSRVR